MKKLLCFLCLCSFLIIGSSVGATGISWNRGDSGSTWQDWSFDTAVNPAQPENYFNSYGIPLASITVSGAVHEDLPGWYDNYLGRDGVWHGDFASVALVIPNTQIRNPYKEVWVEVGFRGELLTNPSYPGYGPEYDPKLIGYVDGQPVMGVEIGREIVNVGSGWRRLTIGWRVYPNPDSEEIYLAFHNSGADIDYVYVDTICIPEPATVCLFALGGTLLFRRKVRA